MFWQPSIPVEDLNFENHPQGHVNKYRFAPINGIGNKTLEKIVYSTINLFLFVFSNLFISVKFSRKII